MVARQIVTRVVGRAKDAEAKMRKLSSGAATVSTEAAGRS
jgi:hypothetical protein